MLQNKKLQISLKLLSKIQYRELKFLLEFGILFFFGILEKFIPLMPLQIPCGRFFQLRQA